MGTNASAMSNGASVVLLSLEDRLEHSIVPRKAFEVLDLQGETPVTCTEEAISFAKLYLKAHDIDSTETDDVTHWDVFWARELAAAQMVMGDRGLPYQSFLPGRQLMYELLADSIASLFNENDNQLSDSEIAEIGGGSGIGLALLAQKGAMVTNLDSSVMALEFSRYLAIQHKVEHMLNTVQGDFYGTGIDSDRFDVVYNHGVFEHKEVNADNLLSEMIRITKPGGYVVIAIPNEQSPFYTGLSKKHDAVYKKFKGAMALMPWHYHRRNVDIKGLMESASLDVVREDGLLIPPSEKIRMKDILDADIPTFEKYLLPDPPASLGSILSNWRGFHGSTDSSFRMRYGWAIYAIGQKRAT